MRELYRETLIENIDLSGSIYSSATEIGRINMNDIPGAGGRRPLMVVLRCKFTSVTGGTMATMATIYPHAVAAGVAGVART